MDDALFLKVVHCKSRIFICAFPPTTENNYNQYVSSLNSLPILLLSLLPMVLTVFVVVMVIYAWMDIDFRKVHKVHLVRKRRTLNKGSQKSAKPLLSSTHMLSAIPPCTIKVAPMNFKWLVIFSPLQVRNENILNIVRIHIV